MRTTLFLIVTLMCVVVATVHALDYPRPAKAFSSGITFQVSDQQHTENYNGTMYHNSQEGKQLVEVPDDSYARLERWDQVRFVF
jgi:hypothetical protein